MYSKTWKTHVSFSDMYAKVLDITILFKFYIMFRWGEKIQFWCIFVDNTKKKKQYNLNAEMLIC